MFCQFLKIDFVKSTMFKKKIKARAEEGIKDSAEKWHEYARNHGHFNKKPLQLDNESE